MGDADPSMRKKESNQRNSGTPNYVDEGDIEYNVDHFPFDDLENEDFEINLDFPFDNLENENFEINLGNNVEDNPVIPNSETAPLETTHETSSDNEVVSEEDIVGSDVELDERCISDEEQSETLYTMFDMDNIWNPTFYCGQSYANIKNFMKAVDSHAIMTKRNLYISRQDAGRCYARCRVEECEWRINLIKTIGEKSFFIREYFEHHIYPPIPEVKNISSTWLAERYLYKFKSDKKRDVEGFRQDCVNEIRVNISKDQAYRAKRIATKILEGKPDLQYNKLWDYAEELRKTNPGSTIILGTEEKDGDTIFSRFYVCFKALKDGFNKGCRPIIGVDGCHLKGPHGGILLSAVGLDANNAIYPVAYAVVGQERSETWSWFLTILKRDLEIERDETFTIISDKQKGLINAIDEVFPGSPNRFCARHLLQNFIKAGFRGVAFKNAFWAAAYSSTKGQFRLNMQKMKELDNAAAEWFIDKPSEQWSLSHFSTHCKTDMLLNNCCESFNSSICAAREKPIITMLEWLREYLMKNLRLSRDTAEKWKGPLCPKINEILSSHVQKVADCIPLKASDTHYQVSTCDGAMYAINLAQQSCTCRKWEITGIPCKHAISAMLKQKLDPVQFVDPCYFVETYKKAYKPVIFPISGEELWSSSLFIPPMPPNFGRGVGRPSRARRREPNEPENHRKRKSKGRKQAQVIKRQTPTVHCSLCGVTGHNIRGCQNAPNKMKRKNDGEGTSSGTTNLVDVEIANQTQSTTSTINNPENSGPTIQPPVTEVDDSIEMYIDESTNPSESMREMIDVPVRNVRGPSMFEQLQQGTNYLPQHTVTVTSNMSSRTRRMEQFGGGSFSNIAARPPRPRKTKRSLDKGKGTVLQGTQESSNN